MIQPCFHCGIPLQRASQYIGIADVIFGLLNFIILVVHVKEVYTGSTDTDDSSSPYGDNSSSYSGQSSYRKRIHTRTFSGLDILPPELVLVIVVFHAIQFVMGIVLYISAANKSRNVCLIWLVVTAFTVLFTGILFRLYEMLIVNEFTHELKEELEVTYFPGHNPIQVGQVQQPYQHHHHQHPNNMMNQQPMDNISFNYPADSHVSVITIPTVGPVPTPYPVQPSEYNMNPPASSPYYPPITPMNHHPNIPAALQPPPQYDVAVGGAGMYAGVGGGTGGPNNRSTGIHTIESVIFPNGNNDYGKSFSKF